jgi:chaperone modulatory protein CbpM
MQAEFPSPLWLDSSQRVSLDELVIMSGLTEHEIVTLVEGGALLPVSIENAAFTFGADCIATVRRAARLRDQLELDSHALIVALSLLEQIRALEEELAHLRAQLPEFRRP